MLDRLEQAFAQRQESEDRLRRFLSDASHELRTPLASIRGYAELFRMGAARDPEDVAKAMRRIEDEAARMGVLVEDLLALARLDELRDPVRAARRRRPGRRATPSTTRAPRRPTATIALEADAGAAVLGDPDQLRQVLANLLRNALVHTPPGTPVEVASTGGRRRRLACATTARGCPTADADALFDRFWRAEGGRERGKAGAGPRAGHRGRDRRGPPRARGRRERRRRRRVLHRAPPDRRQLASRRHGDDDGDHFQIEEGSDDGTIVLTLRGELDLASADDVQRRLEALCSDRTPTRLDLDDLAFMDSSGLRVVLQAAELGRDSDWAFTLTPGSEQVRQLFRSAGVAERLPIIPRP